MIEAIEPGAIGAHGPDRPGGPVADVVRLQAGADAAVPGHGAGPVGRLLVAVAAMPGECDEIADLDAEFRAALLAELVRRYLRAVRGHARGRAAPRVWQVVLDRWANGGDPARTALAGAHALVCHDLPPAVVSACTLLGRTPGRAERGVVESVADRITGLATTTAVRGTSGGDVALLLPGGECWRQAEHLWTVRGRPSEAEKQRAALDWRAALVARALLGS